MVTEGENVSEEKCHGAAIAKVHEVHEAILKATVRFGNADRVVAL